MNCERCGLPISENAPQWEDQPVHAGTGTCIRLLRAELEEKNDKIECLTLELDNERRRHEEVVTAFWQMLDEIDPLPPPTSGPAKTVPPITPDRSTMG